MSSLDLHRARLTDTYNRYRQDFSRFFHGLTNSPADRDDLASRFPGITYGHCVAALRVFEERNVQFEVISILSHADTLMADYATDYRIDVSNGYCEMKYIYFVAIAFAQRLENVAKQEDERDAGQVRAASLYYAALIVRFGMIANLDSLLVRDGINKPELRAAMKRLIMSNKFEQEMGRTGCYIVYKSLSRMAKSD